MRLPTLPFHGPTRPALPTITLMLPQIRHQTGSASPAAPRGSTSWRKNTGKKKPTSGSSNNPFLQGMDFNRADERLALGRGMLFSQKPLRGLRLNEQDQIRHDTIHRAWMMFQSARRRTKIRRLKLLEKSIAETMKVLKETDENLYALAVSGARHEEKRFPLVMRIPTDTLPSNRWNYKWTNMNIKGAGGVVKPG